MTVRILGLDPGLAHCGFAWLENDGAGWRLVSASTFCSEPAKAKARLHALDDTASRVRALARDLHLGLRAARPNVVAVEGYSQPQFAAGALRLGFAWGAVVAVLECHDLPVVQLAPQAVKSALGIQSGGRPRGRKTQAEIDRESKARKDLVGWRLEELIPGARAILTAMRSDCVEHATDAAAVAYAATATDLVRAAAGRAAS